MIDIGVVQDGTKYRIIRNGGDFFPTSVMHLRFSKDEANFIKTVIESAYRCGQEEVKSSLRHILDVPQNPSDW